MWAYDLIKRNKCLITIGKTQKSGLTMVAENAKKPPPRQWNPGSEFDRCEADNDNEPPGPVYESSTYQAGEIKVPCYFLSTPKIAFQANFSEQDDLLSKIMGPVTAGLHTANMMLPAIDYIDANLDTLMDSGAAALNALTQGKEKAAQGGQSKVTYSANKANAVMGSLGNAMKVFEGAGARETRTFRAGNVVSWQGCSPVEFSLEVLFCRPNGGVHMGALYPLMEAVNFSELMFGNFMYGPRGYNSAGFGISAMERILNGEFSSLHSLALWHSAEDDFNNKRAYTRNIVLDLFRLLVITSVQIEKSEQLFFDPTIDELHTAPLYKWIKATIGFKTACPIPGTLWQVSDKGNRPNGRTNASLHDFYGSADASFGPLYPKPISEVAPPNGSDTVMGWEDYSRLTGFGESFKETGKILADGTQEMPDLNIMGEG